VTNFLFYFLPNAVLTGRAGKAQAPGRPGSVQQPGSGARRREQTAERSERRIPGDEVARNVVRQQRLEREAWKPLDERTCFA